MCATRERNKKSNKLLLPNPKGLEFVDQSPFEYRLNLTAIFLAQLNSLT